MPYAEQMKRYSLLPSVLLMLAIECSFGYNKEVIAKSSSISSAAVINATTEKYSPRIENGINLSPATTKQPAKQANAFSFAPYVLVDPASNQDQNPNQIVQTAQL